MTTGRSLKKPAAIVVAAALSIGGRSLAQQPAPPGVKLADFAQRRHPQPVRVGDLIRRPVLEPRESRPVLGHVSEVVRCSDGTQAIIMKTGGWLGFGSRSIAVPVAAMALLGAELEILDFTPAQLAAFPTYDGTGTTPMAPDAVIRMALAHPSH